MIKAPLGGVLFLYPIQAQEQGLHSAVPIERDEATRPTGTIRDHFTWFASAIYFSTY